MDLLACALAAVIVQWLFLLPNQGNAFEGRERRVNATIVLEQYGTAHIHSSATLSNPAWAAGGGSTAFVAPFPIELEAPASDKPRGSIRVSKSTTPGVNNTTLSFIDVRPGTRLIYSFFACHSPSHPHAIQALIIDGSGQRYEMLFVHEDTALQNAMAAPKASAIRSKIVAPGTSNKTEQRAFRKLAKDLDGAFATPTTGTPAGIATRPRFMVVTTTAKNGIRHGSIATLEFRVSLSGRISIMPGSPSALPGHATLREVGGNSTRDPFDSSSMGPGAVAAARAELLPALKAWWMCVGQGNCT